MHFVVPPGTRRSRPRSKSLARSFASVRSAAPGCARRSAGITAEVCARRVRPISVSTQRPFRPWLPSNRPRFRCVRPTSFVDSTCRRSSAPRRLARSARRRWLRGQRSVRNAEPASELLQREDLASARAAARRSARAAASARSAAPRCRARAESAPLLGPRRDRCVAQHSVSPVPEARSLKPHDGGTGVAVTSLHAPRTHRLRDA